MEVPIDQLYLDPNNYRFPDLEEVWEEIPEEEITNLEVQTATIAKIMGMKDTPLLKKSIRESRGPLDRPIVVRISKNQYKVLEGNRRIACTKRILDEIKEEIWIEGQKKKKLSKAKLKELKKLKEIEKDLALLPVLSIKKEVDTPENQREILGIRHTVGVKAWGPYQRGKVIQEFVDNEGKDAKEIGRMIGMSPTEVKKCYRAFGAFRQFCEETDSTDARKYSYFMEAAGKRNVRDFLDMDHTTGRCCRKGHREFFYDIITPQDNIPARLLDAKDVRKLSKILDNPKAFEAFEGGMSIDEVVGMTRGPKPDEWIIKVDIATRALNVPHSELVSIGKSEEKQLRIKYLIECLQKILADAKRLVSGRK